MTIFCGKVDLGQGLRIAIPQMAAEELGVAVERITMIEGDTALTPDQGPTAGSTGVMRGGVQIRQAAATAREALIGLAAARAGRPAAELGAIDGEVRPEGRRQGLSASATSSATRRFGLKLDPKAPLKSPGTYTVVGKPLPRPDVPGKVTGRHVFMHDFKVDGMLHGRVMRPAAVGAKLVAVDEALDHATSPARAWCASTISSASSPTDEWDARSPPRAS